MENTKAVPQVALNTLEKHVEIDNAVDYLGQLVARMSNLRDRINGLDTCPHDSPEKTTPCLQYVLSETAGDIRHKCDAAHEIISEIEGQIF
jgi:excinuclease UvrABC nuclease subunit